MKSCKESWAQLLSSSCPSHLVIVRAEFFRRILNNLLPFCLDSIMQDYVHPSPLKLQIYQLAGRVHTMHPALVRPTTSRDICNGFIKTFLILFLHSICNLWMDSWLLKCLGHKTDSVSYWFIIEYFIPSRFELFCSCSQSSFELGQGTLLLDNGSKSTSLYDLYFFQKLLSFAQFDVPNFGHYYSLLIFLTQDQLLWPFTLKIFWTVQLSFDIKTERPLTKQLFVITSLKTVKLAARCVCHNEC